MLDNKYTLITQGKLNYFLEAYPSEISYYEFISSLLEENRKFWTKFIHALWVTLLNLFTNRICSAFIGGKVIEKDLQKYFLADL